MDLFGLTPEPVGVVVPPIVMTIGGSDSGGGAGIQADLKTFMACKVHGTNVMTLVTAQNTRGVDEIFMIPEHIIGAQFQSLMTDLPPVAGKTGALGSERVIEYVAELLEDKPIEKLVVDPVMVSKHGNPLMPESAFKMFRAAMIQRAFVITPNRFEAEVMYGKSVDSVGTMREAAKAIFDQGARYVLVKGRAEGNVVRDIFYDGSGFIEFGADCVKSKRVHGSGCTHSAAITAQLALGLEIEDAVAFAREFISNAIEYAPRLTEYTSPVDPGRGNPAS